ncbi:ATP phosphoribosyltransferase regulatory subunit [Thermomicrobium sp. 4228-Ro]|uniref:histidine--tRNA ligase n=1 Tax=Thermomicrobium sp. 4228-Ro TaxID=2993937 RepID=UPI0022487B15|nr:ATP phosphoribosyltransferase regulatory subunit [Thermomicrobium sp. 4228-Ro]MCX2726245.1 ATP phosphoribosyltransferase regulatory subunit [Thermomicrobium sp. 4228-Ro]
MTANQSSDLLQPLERLRGMHDVGPERFRRRQRVLRRIQHVIERHGYEFVETPILEPTELFLRKAGPERIAQLYAFTFRNRDIALRPEHTASILRYYIDARQNDPLPLRLAYAGPVFRYERPQAGRTRQFTEIGCELLGAPGASGDAEIIHLASEILESLGIRPRIVIGHVGIVLDYLQRLPLRQRARDWLLWSMERLRKGQEVDLEKDLPGLTGGSTVAQLSRELSEKLAPLDRAELERLVLALLREVGLQVTSGSRTPDEIVRGVLAKLERSTDTETLRRGYAFARELAGLNGTPDSVLPELHRLIERYALDPEPLRQIDQLLTLLAGYGITTDRIELAPGMARGLHYYTGILFEIYPEGDGDLQLCGGGRYDDLAQLLGARSPLPACGFAGGIERIADAATLTNPPAIPRLLVMATTVDALPQAERVAEQLRAQGAIVELDVRQRSLSANRRYARRRGIHRLIVVDLSGTVEEIDLLQGRAGDG